MEDALRTRLKEIALLLGFGDARLQHLLFMANDLPDEYYIGVPIGLIVGGHVVNGTLTSPIEFAKHMDSTLADAFRKAQPEPNEPMAERYDEGWMREQAREGRSDMGAVREYLDETFPDAEDFDLEKIPAERLYATLNYIHMTPVFALQNASIYMGGQWVKIGFLRVWTHEIGAWWLLPTAQQTQAAND
jgi:hypothetical protein